MLWHQIRNESQKENTFAIGLKSGVSTELEGGYKNTCKSFLVRTKTKDL